MGDHEKTPGMRMAIFWLAEIMIIVTLGVIVVFITKHPGPLKAPNYDWHPILNTFAFVGFGFNGVMAFRIFPGSHTMRKTVHFFMHTIALGGSITAVVLIYKFHNANQIPNMYSTHSVVGMAALVMFGVQWLAGFLSFVMPATPKWFRFMAVPFHKFMGVASMMAVTAAMVLGAMDRQRITWELPNTCADPDYTSPTNRWANAYAMCVLASAFLVGCVLNKASEGIPDPRKSPANEMSRSVSQNGDSSSYAKLADTGHSQRDYGAA